MTDPGPVEPPSPSAARRRRLVWGLLAVELILTVAAAGWRGSRPAVPRANLSRLPESTAADLARLQAAVWSDRPAAWQELGEAYLTFGYFTEGTACLDRAVALDPHNPQALMAYAYALERIGRLHEANAVWERAALTSDEPDRCWFHFGRNCLRRNNKDQELRALKAFERAGAYLPAVHERARLAIRDGRARDALPLIEQMRKTLGLSVRVEMLAVQANRDLGNLLEAARAEERANRASDTLGVNDSWEFLQPVRVRYGLTAEMARIESLMQDGDSDAAADIAQRVMEATAPQHVETLLTTAAQVTLLARRPESTRALLDRFALRLALPASALEARGSARATLGDLEGARDDWTRAVSIQPTFRQHEFLARLLTEQGKAPEARPHEGQAQLLAGIAGYRLNDLPRALEHLQTAGTILKDDPRVWFALAEAHFARNDLPAAVAACEQCLTLNPHHGRARERLAVLKPAIRPTP